MADTTSLLLAEPCAVAIHSLRSSLAEATKPRPEDEDVSSGTNSVHRIALKCGHVKYQEHRTAWSLHHKLKCDERSRIESLGFAGTNSENQMALKPIVFRSAKRICRLTYMSEKRSARDAPVFPPLPLVQLIFRAVELISMLEGARVEYHSNSYQEIPCWSKVTRRSIDVKPIFDTLWQFHAAKKSRKRVVDRLLALAIESVTDVANQMVEPWRKRWNIHIDLPRRSGKLKSHVRASLNSVKYFVRACLLDSKVTTKHIRSILDSPARTELELRINTADDPFDSSSASDAREVSGVESSSTCETEEHYGNNKDSLCAKRRYGLASDGDQVTTPLQQRELERLYKAVHVAQSPKSSPLTSEAPNRKPSSPHIESGSQQDANTCAIPPGGAKASEPSDMDSRKKKTELSAIRREVGSNSESSSETKEYRGNKKKSIGQPESRRKCEDNELGETLNLIVDEDSCTSRNEDDEVSSQSTGKQDHIIVEQQVEAKNQELKTGSTAIELGGLSRLDSSLDKPPEVSGQAASGLGSVPDHLGGSELSNESFEENDNSWVKLSHMGHISDYHGYQRQHQSFVPLKYSSSVSETCESLEETLKATRPGASNKGDEDADSDQEDYDAAVLSYSANQVYERTQRSDSSHQVQKTAKEVPLDIDFEIRPFRFMPATLTNAGNSKKRKHACVQPQNWIPTPSFNSIETDPLSFWRNNQNTAKRPRRTAELNELKKISVMMLSEMYHTLRFIQKYNEGFCSESNIPAVADPSIREDNFDGRELERKQNPEDQEPSGSKQGDRKTIGSRVDLVAQSMEALPLKKMFMKLSFFEKIRMQFPCLGDLPEDSSFKIFQSAVESAIKDQKVRIYSDDEVVKEEKSRTRIARGYKRKADQEKIEKKHHEDERLLLLREFEYANRNKKVSAMEIEMERFEARPIMVDQPDTQSNTDRCELGPSCIICEPATLPQASPTEEVEATIIHNPSFRQVDLDAIEDEDPQNGVLHENDRVDASLRSLMEMRHILSFTEKYNKGLIR